SYFLGIELNPNFRAPLVAGSINEFWKRWHISFTGWLREYIYLPLSRFMIRKTRSGRHFLNFMIPVGATMLISALWHGVAKEHLLWAGMVGVLMMAEQFSRANLPPRAPSKKPFWGWGIMRMILLTPLVVPFFHSWSDSLYMWRKLVISAPIIFN